jgi:hypothetical protein
MHPGMLVAIVLVGFGLGVGAYRILGSSSFRATSKLAVEAYQKAEHLAREGGRLVVPQNSPLRGAGDSGRSPLAVP